MPTLRTYQKAEEASLDAAYLGSLGIEVCVVDKCGYGGIAIEINDPHFRIDVPEEQLREAEEWLAKRGAVDAVIQTAVFEPTWDASTLAHFLKILLVFDLGCYAVFLLIGHVIQQPPPKEVNAYLLSLAISDLGWDFAYISYWPLTATALVSNVLCLFYSRFGRLLFLITTIWSLITTLGPPPQIFAPGIGFLASLQFTASNLALALMYWSPVRQKFDRRVLS